MAATNHERVGQDLDLTGQGWAQEALPYNGLVVAWSDMGRMAGERAREMPVQGRLF